MALISVNATKTGWHAVTPLAPALQALTHGAGVTILIHGFRFSPWDRDNDPHSHILSPDPRRDCWKAVSWPRHLHLTGAAGGAGRLGIGFGWHARGGLAKVADHAFDIGLTLAGMISTIHACRPDIHVNILAHSLGARVALRAVAALPKGHVHRLILLSGAEYRGQAQAAMATPCGRGLQALNVTSGENAVFDGIFRIAVPAAGWRDWPLSAGLTDAADWTDLRVDCPAALAALRAFGIRTRAPVTRVCHWSTYLRPGLFKLYRGVCDPGDPDLLARLAATLPSSPRYADRGRDLRLSPL